MKRMKKHPANTLCRSRLFPIVLLFIIVTFMFTSQLRAQSGAVKGVHDPCIIKCDDNYYVFSTGDRIDIRRSPNLIRWQKLGSVFNTIPAWGRQEVPGVSNIWAPDIFYKDSTYYLYYSLSTFGSNRSRIGLATNVTLNPSDPDYEWIDQGKVYESNANNNFNAIDPNIVMDTSGDFWMSFGSFWSGIKMVQLDPVTMKPPAGSIPIYSIAGRGGGAIEAPFIIYKDGYYYLFVSFDLCCRGVNSSYNIRVGRSTQVTGIYRDKSERSMVTGGGTRLLSGDSRWKGTGHCAVYTNGTAYWLVFHAYDALDNGMPTMRVMHMYWDEDGWPLLDDTIPVQTKHSDTQPHHYALYPNYPNPFNPSTIIAFDVKKTSDVQLTVFNINGQEIRSLVKESLPSGHYTIPFHAALLPSGMYFYSIHMNEFYDMKKMILIH